MVKTRLQRQYNEKEEERLRTIQPPKVCGTPPMSAKRAAPPSAIQSVSAKKKRLTFTADPPQEFLFSLSSPPARRLHSNHDLVHESVVRIEFEARLEEHTAPMEVGEKERTMYREWMSNDLKQELKALHGIDGIHMNNDVHSLKGRLELAETLRRRSELRRVPQLSVLPNKMSLRDIQKELSKRRISFLNLTHYQACEALERALLKEDTEGLVGEGYQFGRRLVSAADIISFYQPSDKEMRDMLQSRSIKGSLIPRKKSQKLELLSKYVELEQEQLVRNLVKEEIKRELERRSIEKEDTDDFNVLFETLFQSGKWKTNYDDVDNTPLVLNSEDTTSGCVIT
jgi:hypothetical protein